MLHQFHTYGQANQTLQLSHICLCKLSFLILKAFAGLLLALAEWKTFCMSFSKITTKCKAPKISGIFKDLAINMINIYILILKIVANGLMLSGFCIT